MFYLLVFIVALAVYSSNNDPPIDIKIPCPATFNTTNKVIWPYTNHGTCSFSYPSCTNIETGKLQMRCCNNGEFSRENCMPGENGPDPKDPRCFDGMKSVSDQKSLDFCFKLTDQPVTNPINCDTTTGLMITIENDLLNMFSSNDYGIWLPFNEFEKNVFRSTQRNQFYLDKMPTKLDFHPSNSTKSPSCTILKNYVTQEVSCDEKHFGMCLDYPLVIHPFDKNYLKTFLYEVSDYCSQHPLKLFCITYKVNYDLNVVYYSSRKFMNEPYLYLQKSNLRVLLQPRKNSFFESQTVYVHAALSEYDWEIFTNTSFQFSIPKDVEKTPEIKIEMQNNSLKLSESNNENIKWIQKDYESQYLVYCFLNSSKNGLERLELRVGEKYDLKIDQNSNFWCDAFDFDLNIIRSNILGPNQMEYTYISEHNFLFFYPDCEQDECEEIIKLIIGDRTDIEFHIVSMKEQPNNAVIVTTLWYIQNPAETIPEVEKEYNSLKEILSDLNPTRKVLSVDLNYLNHKSFCVGKSSQLHSIYFEWPTIPRSQVVYITSFPECYSEIDGSLSVRACQTDPNGFSEWDSEPETCVLSSNLTRVFDQVSQYDGDNYDLVITDLNLIISDREFDYISSIDSKDFSLMVGFLSKLVDENVNFKIQNLCDLIDNLYLLKQSALNQATLEDLRRNLDEILLEKNDGSDFVSKNYAKITLDFSKEIIHGIKLIPDGPTYKVEKMINRTDSNEEFDVVIFFDEEFLVQIQNAVRKTVILSIFPQNYLFQTENSINNDVIFRILIPDENIPINHIYFSSTKVNKNYICSCYDSNSNSNWVPEIKFHTENPVCMFKNAQNSYCRFTRIMEESQTTFVTNVCIKFSETMEDFQIYNELTDLISKYAEPTLNFGITLNGENQMEFNVEILWYKTLSVNLKADYISMKNLVDNIIGDPQFDMKLIYSRPTKFCMKFEEVISNQTFEWPTTLIGESTYSLPMCLDENNDKVELNCIGNSSIGAFWDKSDRKCQVKNVTETLVEIIDNFNSTNTNVILDNLNEMTVISNDDFQPKDIYLLSNILTLIGNETYEVEVGLNETSLSSLINNIQEMNRTSLRDSQAEFNATDNILSSLDTILMANFKEMRNDNNMSHFSVLKLGNYSGVYLEKNDETYEVGIVRSPEEYLKLLTENDQIETVIFFNNENSTSNVILTIFFEDSLFNDLENDWKTSIIFGILITNEGIDELESDEVEIDFIFPKKYEEIQHGCVYWNYGEGIIGSWHNESFPTQISSFPSCKFNHTTHFAMLLIDGKINFLSGFLSITTDIGCFLSLVGFLGILATGLLFKQWRRNLGNILLLNFSFAVLMQIILLYFSSFIHEIVGTDSSCMVIGSLLHYSVLSAFCWMLMIAFLQFKRFVQVFTGPPKNILIKSILFGWVVSAIPVIAILLINPKSYISSETGLCYPSKLGLYLGIWLPIIVIMIINLIIFVSIIANIFNRKTECVNTMSTEIVFQCKLAFLLFFMLGLTWSFGLIGEFFMRKIFLSLFCITAPLQGFIIFLYFILFNERTRMMYVTLIKKLFKKHTHNIY